MFPVLTAPNRLIWYGSSTTLEMRKLWSMAFRRTHDCSPDFYSCWLLRSKSLWVLWLHRDYGQVTNPFLAAEVDLVFSKRRCRVYTCSAASPIQRYIWDELQEQLFSVRDKDVSLTSLSVPFVVWHWMDYIWISKTAAERNELLQALWQAEYGDIPAEYLFATSSVVTGPTKRNHGVGRSWACLCTRATFIQGQHYSILLPLTADGFIALDIFEGW